MRQVVVAHVHLAHDPLQSLCGLLGVSNDRGDQVWDALVGGQFHALGVNQDHAHFFRGRTHQHRGDQGVNARGLTSTSGTSDQNVRHLRQVRDDEVALNVLTQRHHHRVVLRRGFLATNHIAELDHIAIDVGDFNTNSGLARNDINDAHIGTLNRIRDVALQGGDFFHLDGRAKFDFVTRDGGATSKAGDLSINTEFIQHTGQGSNDGVVGLGTLPGWFTLVEQVLGR